MIHLENWTGKREQQEYLNQPFNFNGKTIASNGHMMIAVPEISGYEPVSQKIKDSLAKFLEPAESYEPLPTNIGLPESEDCHVCKGSGNASCHECEECRGEGVIELHNRYNYYTHQCKTCDGEGEITQPDTDEFCYLCLGIGKRYEREAYVEVLDVHLNPIYFQLLAALDAVEVASQGVMIKFRSPEGNGVIMGMRKDRP